MEKRGALQLFEVAEPLRSQKIQGRHGRDEWKIPSVPRGIEFHIVKDTARVRLASVGEYEFCVDIDRKISQHAQLAQEAGWNRIGLAEVVKNGDDIRLIESQNGFDLRAIVLLSTRAGVGGVLRLTANTFQETLIDVPYKGYTTQRIERVFDAFPPTGVELINNIHVHLDKRGVCRWQPDWGFTEEDSSPPVLLKMIAGSSFRIWRTGDVGDADRNFLVSWSGHELRTVVPKNEQRNG